MSSEDGKIGRRGLLGVSGLLAGTALVKGAAAEGATAAQAGGTFKTLGPGLVPLQLTVNGQERRLQLEPRATLAEALRDELHLTGTKIACDRGSCGACTVHLDGLPVVSCLSFALDAAGRRVTTVEGLAVAEGKLAPLQEAFVAKDALQCGFCTPGMLMSCAALLAQKKAIGPDEVRHAVSGNLCRCGTYPKVIEAALAAAGGVAVIPAQAQTALSRLQRPESFTVGVAGTELAREKREVPEGEPPAWDGAVQLSSVGSRVSRLDGAAKVTGAAKYAFDVQLPGMLYAAVVRSPHAHALVKSIDLGKARSAPGVKAAIAVERVLGPARLKLTPKASGRWPKILYEGQPVAAVAAISQALADEAAAQVLVEYQPLPAATDLHGARLAGAPLVFEGPVEMPGSAGGGGAAKGLPQRGNVRGPLVKTRGGSDVEGALAKCAAVHEATYSTQVQTHSAMETHGVVASFTADGLEVWASTQGLFTVKDELATLFELPKSKVRVHCEFAGGGFGAKFGAGNFGVLAATLSKLSKAPVRLFLDRRAEHLAVGNRPSTVQSLRLGVDAHGKLQAIDLKAFGSAGCAAGAGCSGPVHNLYSCENVRSEEEDVFLHSGPAAAFRAPGHPQGAFALEQAMDELAEQTGRDPLELRELNDAHPARREERKRGAALIGWKEKRQVRPGGSPGRVKRGVGFAQGLWYNFDGPPAFAEVVIHNDGTVECKSGVQDIGGGIRTLMAQTVAEELGVKPSEVHVSIGDTDFPQGPSSGGSMTTQLLLPAVRKAAYDAHRKLAAEVPGLRGVREAAPMMRGEMIRAQGERARDYPGWSAGPGDLRSRIGGAQFAEVEVDTETGVVRVLRVVAVHDCGRAINRLTTESQINGGIIQGISLALFEDRILDRATGRMVNANLDQYKIAGSKDVPVIDTVILDHYRGRTSVDASGIGEPATVPTAAAIANAIHHAIGVRVREAPITPAKVLAALQAQRSGGAP